MGSKVFTYDQNRCSFKTSMGVHIKSEWMFRLGQNMQHKALTDDLGGVDQLSYQQRALVERALWLEYHLQLEEQKLANGQEFDSGKWTQSCNALQGILSKLGLHRVAKTIPALQHYVNGGKK